MSTTTYIGLIGFGTVGQGFYEILQSSNYPQLVIQKIGIKNRDKQRQLGSHWFTENLNEIIDDPKISVIVEAIDDAEVAFELAKQALQKGKNVISANKKMIAENYLQLKAIEDESEGRILFEAAVAGGIPILQTVNNYQSNLKVDRLQAILNGSSNYILTQIQQQSWSYKKAVEEAQQIGFAESDPSLDVGGFDARYKLALLNSFAFGTFIDPNSIPRWGIEQLDKTDLEWAAIQKAVIKPLAVSEKNPSGQLISWVAPALIPLHHPLSELDNELNGILLNSAFGGEQLLSGKGAGKLPTGSAVFNDLLLLNKGYRYSQLALSNRQEENKEGIRLVLRTAPQINLPDFVEIIEFSFEQAHKLIAVKVPYDRLQALFDYADKHNISPIVDLRFESTQEQDLAPTALAAATL